MDRSCSTGELACPCSCLEDGKSWWPDLFTNIALLMFTVQVGAAILVLLLMHQFDMLIQLGGSNLDFIGYRLKLLISKIFFKKKENHTKELLSLFF